MTKQNEKRSTAHGIGDGYSRQADLFGGVGGRQASPRQSRRGGGYQNKCTVLNFSPDAEQKKRDPRLDELREMGLRRVWLDVAEAIGMDNMLKLWRIIDASETRLGDDGEIRVPLRRYSSYLRYQRNRYIEELFKVGLKPKEIREKLNKQLCEKISLRHISRIINRE